MKKTAVFRCLFALVAACLLATGGAHAGPVLERIRATGIFKMGYRANGAPFSWIDSENGGVGIGGVLEPLQAAPTIIEDNCFIGARSEIVEGVIVEEGSVISMGVYIGQSTKIYDRETGEIHYGRVPAGSVVVSGSLPAKDGSHSLYCAVIVKKVDAQTRAKTSVNELLRDV